MAIEEVGGAACEGQQPSGVVDEDRLDLGLAEAAAAHHRDDVAEDVAVAVAAEKLDGLGRPRLGTARRVELGHCRFLEKRLSGVF